MLYFLKEKINIGDAEKVLEKEEKEKEKEKYQGSVDDVIKIFPFLWKCLCEVLGS